jgi:putative spermidine/putrescine transport system permease protein
VTRVHGASTIGEGGATGTAAEGRHKERLAAYEVRERRQLLMLSAPSTAIIAVLLGVPAIWLFGLSFWSDGVSFEHYGRILNDGGYATTFLLTFEIAAVVTAITVVIGYPLSLFICVLPRAWRALALACVLLPFWTSILVRTYAWLVLLQRRGLINAMLLDLGIIDTPLRLAHNATGTTIGMIHILLPYLVLPLYASIQRVDLDLVRAAASLGSTPGYTFWRVFFPLTLPGLLAGAFLVFILALGFYITPELMGGGSTVMISMLIQRNVELYFQWGAASAVAVVLVLLVFGLLCTLSRLVPLERMYGGGR